MAPELLQRHRGIVRAIAGTRGGEDQGTEGDSFFFQFERASDAFPTAVEAIRRYLVEVIADLVNKSLVQRERMVIGTRYRLWSPSDSSR